MVLDFRKGAFLPKKRERKAVVSKNVDIRNDSFNILVSGVDFISEDINEKGSSDVNIIVRVNPQTYKVLMQVVPRDTWTVLLCVNGEMRWTDDEVTGEYLYYFYPYEGKIDVFKERIENI